MRRWAHALLGRLVGVEDSEIPALLLACAYGFAIFTAYAVIRPLRDAMALVGGSLVSPRSASPSEASSDPA